MNDLFQTLGESIKQIDFTHAFLGLTKGKSPDELDKADETLRQEYLKNKEWDKIDQKWYEAKEPNEFNDGFWGILGNYFFVYIKICKKVK
ncbi:TPA: hypothetical protein R8I24_001773 [Campylobacter jejuni]|nr:hypothetical protein [Campylobacter jejuni]HEF3652001.1 hypothetical protein [Campylobacter jejuni]